MNDTFECVAIAITNDNKVEGTEEFNVSFVETDTNMIMTAGDRTVPVCIEDDEGMCIFDRKQYSCPYEISTIW